MDKNKLAKAISNLIPQIIRGVHVDFFTKKSAITQTQFFMLIAMKGSGLCTMSSLAKNMAIKLPTATVMVDRLVKTGLVKREAKVGDRRTVLVSLTPKGELYIEGFKTVVAKRWRQVLGNLNDAETKQFYGIVLKLTQSLTPSKP